jgi:Na+-transporting methylmalonyl-CoA/oxaloacetate decarboxylase gamma subunit
MDSNLTLLIFGMAFIFAMALIFLILGYKFIGTVKEIAHEAIEVYKNKDTMSIAKEHSRAIMIGAIDGVDEMLSPGCVAGYLVSRKKRPSLEGTAIISDEIK